jgi:hypothetical protein
VIRKSLSSAPEYSTGIPSRRGGDRKETNDRIVFLYEGRRIDGWALNESTGGLRAILDEVVPLGAEAEMEIGEKAARPGRVVWIQEEPDGAIIGFEFKDAPGSVPPPPSVR